MAFLEKEQPVPQAEIITLAFHVDYWNRLGWKDEFSSPQFSARQEFYAPKFKVSSIYTPQMIVDGGTEFTGSNTGKATSVITEAAKTPKTSIIATKIGDRLSVKIPELARHEKATVFLAMAEDNLSSNVGAGENKGKKLEHVSVVRELKPIGLIDEAAKSFEAEVDLPSNPAWKRENLKAVFFIQENASRRILAIAKVSLE